MQSEILLDCVYQGQHRDTWQVWGAAEQLHVTACWSACLPQDSPASPAHYAGAEQSCTMPPAQGTISAPGIFGWDSLRWAMDTLHQVGRSKKHCWSRCFSGECSAGFPPAVPYVTCASLLWSLLAPPVTALVHFTRQKVHKQILVPLYCLCAAQMFQARGRPDGATASLDLHGPACQV